MVGRFESKPKPRPWIINFFSELLDGPLPLDKVKQVMLGCNPRSVVGLFKRYLVRIVLGCVVASHRLSQELSSFSACASFAVLGVASGVANCWG